MTGASRTWPEPARAPDRPPHDDFDGDYLVPGIIELHTDQVESHLQPRPQRFWDPVSAVVAHDAQMAASGATTVLDALRIGSDESEPAPRREVAALVRAIRAAQDGGLLRAEHYVHLRCEVSMPDVVRRFDEVGESAMVRLISLMDHTPGERQYADVESFRRYLVGSGRVHDRDFDGMVLCLRDLSAQHSTTHRQQLAARAHDRGVAVATHDDATVEHVAESAGLGVRISEFPTTERAARAATEAGQRVVMGAPNVVRGGSHTGNVAAMELLQAGLLHILSSDYVPASPLIAVFALVDAGVMALPDAMRLVTANPAAAVGFTDRGRIAAGLRADLVRVCHRPIDAEAGRRSVPVVREVRRQGRRVA